MTDSQRPDAGSDDATTPDAPAHPPIVPPQGANPYVQSPVGAPGVNPYVNPTPMPTSSAAPVPPPAAVQQPAPPTVPAPPPYTAQMPGQQAPYAQPGAPMPPAHGYAAPGYPAPGYGAPSFPAPPRPQLNTLGLVAIILGGIGLLIGLVPFAGLVGSLMAIVGLVLGIIGITRKDRPKGLAVAGTAVSGFALVVSLAVTGFTWWAISSFDPYPDSDWTSGSDDYDAAERDEDGNWIAAVPETEADLDLGGTGPGSSTEPYAIDEVFVMVDEYDQTPLWEVRIGAPTLDAGDALAAAHRLNDVAPEGYQFVEIPVEISYLGDGVGTPWFDVSVTGIDGLSYEEAWIYEYPNPARDVTGLGTGETGSFVTHVLVKSDAIEGAVIKVSDWDTGVAYVALTP